MSKFRTRPIRVDFDFEQELRKIKVERIKKGKDVMPKSDRRLTKAIKRHPSWEKMKYDIINADLVDDLP